MRDKPFRLFPGQLLLEPGDITVVLRRIAASPAEQSAEGAKAFKAYFIAHIGNADPFPGQQHFSGLEPYLCYILVRCFLINPGEKTVEVKL